MEVKKTTSKCANTNICMINQAQCKASKSCKMTYQIPVTFKSVCCLHFAVTTYIVGEQK